MSNAANLSSVTPEDLIEMKRHTIEVLKACVEQLAPETLYAHTAYDAVRRAVAELAYAIKLLEVDIDMETKYLEEAHERHEEFLRREAERELAWQAAREIYPAGFEPPKGLDESK